MKLADVKDRIDTFFKNTSSDEIIKHLESQGFEFEDITELLEQTMKVEHLTITGSSSIRDTVDILPRTMAHFAHLEKHPKLSKIDNTPFEVKLTVQHGMAIFDIMKNGQMLFVNVCCFDGKDKEPAMLYLRDLVRGNPFFKTAIIREPKEPLWLFTIPINVLAMTQDDARLAGEIEFYIWNAIRIGLKK